MYVTSIISLEDNHILQTTKDPSGSRVIEAFLASDASAKQKRRLVHKYVLLLLFILQDFTCYIFNVDLLHIPYISYLVSSFFKGFVDILERFHCIHLVHLQLKNASMPAICL